MSGFVIKRRVKRRKKVKMRQDFYFILFIQISFKNIRSLVVIPTHIKAAGRYHIDFLLYLFLFLAIHNRNAEEEIKREREPAVIERRKIKKRCEEKKCFRMN